MNDFDRSNCPPVLACRPAFSEENPAVVDALSGYMEFTEYSSSLIWPEQIPKEDWKKVFIVDARDADQYAKEHIPGAINIEWRQAVARRNEFPRDRMVVMYCNSGSSPHRLCSPCGYWARTT